MSNSKMYTPSKTQLALDFTREEQGKPRFVIPARRLSATNAYEGLKSPVDAVSGGSLSTASPTSSGEPIPSIAGFKPHKIPVTPSKEPDCDYEMQVMRQDTDSTKKVTRSLPSSLHSSSHSHLLNQPGYSDGSPQKLVSRKLSQVQVLSIPEDAQVVHRRHSIAVQPSMTTPRSSRRGSVASTLRTLTMQQSARVTNTNSMTGVPESLAVQELAFRQGQHDSVSSRDRIPSSPFAQHFNVMWAESYKLGKNVGGVPLNHPPITELPHQNFAWPVLINPYTQNFEHPNGFVDMEWAYKMCETALNCMEALIQMVCERRQEWQKIICDIPAPLHEALPAFPDLCERYENLKQDAEEALRGGLPYGY